MIPAGQIRISPSMIYGMNACDGYTFARILLPRLKMSEEDFLTKGKVFHQALEHYGLGDEASKKLQEAVEKDSDLKDQMEVMKGREYLDKIPPELREFKVGIIPLVKMGEYYIHLTGSIDAAYLDEDQKTLVLVDYKTSRLRSKKDVLQMKCYIVIVKHLGMKELSKITGFDIPEDYSVRGLVDYANPEVDQMVPVQFNLGEEEELKNILLSSSQRVLSMYINFIETGEVGDIDFGAGEHCRLCSIRGRCPVYREVAEAASRFLDANPEISSELEDLEEELITLKNLSKTITVREAAVTKAIMQKAYEGSSTIRTKVTNKTSRFLAPELLTTNVRSYSEAREIPPETVVTDLLTLGKVSFTRDQIKELPEYLRDAVVDSTVMDIGKDHLRVQSEKKKNSDPVNERA